MDLAWVWMVRITNVVNSSNFDKLKFVKVSNKLGIAPKKKFMEHKKKLGTQEQNENP
jgi:hypothetical protein